LMAMLLPAVFFGPLASAFALRISLE